MNNKYIIINYSFLQGFFVPKWIFIYLFIYFKIEGNQFTGDDTSLDAIKLRCGDLHGNGYIADIESDEGDWGQWTALISCKTHAGVDASHDFITAFQLQVEGDQVRVKA